ncbi:MAG: hypothetical protein ABF786_08910, partial [Oenococcus oeni]
KIRLIFFYVKSLANETNNAVTAVAAATPKTAGEDMERNAMRATIIAARATTSTIFLKLMANVSQLGKSGKLILISNAIVSASSRTPSSVSKVFQSQGFTSLFYLTCDYANYIDE